MIHPQMIYILVHGHNQGSDDGTLVQILSLKSNVWKLFGHVNYSFHDSKPGILFNEVLYWFCYNANDIKNVFIVSFDLAKEQFIEIPQPDDKRYVWSWHNQLGILNDNLCIFDQHNDGRPYRIWVMKSYNVKRSWKLLATQCEMKDRVHYMIKDSLHSRKMPSYFCCDDTFLSRSGIRAWREPLIKKNHLLPQQNFVSLTVNYQGNSPKRLGKDAKGNTIVHPPVSLDEHVVVQRENKVRALLLQALPKDHMPDFHHYNDARDIWMAVKARFGGNEESKKIRKTMLKQQFIEFSVTEEEGLHKGYDMFQKILSQLDQVQARPDNDDINLKFLRALPSSWSQVALALKTRGGLESMSFDDLYNKLRSLELDVRIGHSYGVKAAAAPTHSAFIGAASSGSKLTYSDQQNIVSSVS
ncbi:ribonuclease H-like domain-containing protein [Tanacetum coccineum]